MLDYSEVALQRCSNKKMTRKHATNLQENTHVEERFIKKVAEQLYLNRTSAWVFFCKFAAFLQYNF